MQKKRILVNRKNFIFCIGDRDSLIQLKTKNPKVIKSLLLFYKKVRMMIWETDHPSGAGHLLTSSIVSIKKKNNGKWEIETANSIYELQL